MEIPKPVGVPYLILEILGREKNTTKGLFIMNFEAKSKEIQEKEQQINQYINDSDKIKFDDSKTFALKGFVMMLVQGNTKMS